LSFKAHEQDSIRDGIKQFIPTVSSAKEIYELFNILNYPKDRLFDPSYKREVEEFDFKKDERDKIKNIYTVLSFEKDLPIFLVESSTTAHSFIKYVAKVLTDSYLRFLLIVTADYNEIVFVLPNLEKVEAGKHKLRISKLVVDKNELYHTDLDTISNLVFVDEPSWRDVWRKWRDAFSVEKVTEEFFRDYRDVFFKVRSGIEKKTATKQAHEFTLQLLNRIMFIYFVSKKRWLKTNKPGDTKFIRYLWNRYLAERNKGNSDKDSFYSDWMTVVFFEAFNNRLKETVKLPDDVKKALFDAPYLNGGLFRKTEYDVSQIKISDELFKAIFSFFEKYNFTIKEELLDVEVAVDPQMIGYVYESLANVAESSYEREEDLRGAWGIFYTPRVEVEFMVRRSLVEYLTNHVPKVPKEKFYELVFDEDKEKAETYFEKEDLWYDLENVLDNLSVVDPACGSGAFLVGMLNVLAELYKVIYKHIRRSLTDFQLKNKIIMKSLYGVDVMPWAIHAAELRLWLQLIVESDLKPDDLKAHPLLPNLNMNLRIGDSLVQEIGGINLHLRDPTVSKVKQRLLDLKIEKERYFNNDPTAKFKTKEELEEEEIRIFGSVIQDRLSVLVEEKAKLEKKLAALKNGVQKDLMGNVLKATPEQTKPIEERLQASSKEIENLEGVKKNLRDPEKKPFVWEIDFAEIFGEKGGFDIVIGNPPYIRHETIAPPTKTREEITEGDVAKYKTNLLLSVQAHLPQVDCINRKSDYYVYFYFSGLALLNQKGSFCFITSNSWLDVEYGVELQKFLLKYCRIVAIYDNPKRSFAHADINTIIALFGAPAHPSNLSLLALPAEKTSIINTSSNLAKFVMFKKPFEEVLNSKTLEKIEETTFLVNEENFRIFPISQKRLFEEGMKSTDEQTEDNPDRENRYIGSKWGATYLRAPDVFFTILTKATKKFTKLNTIAHIETYLNTGGADKFFFVDQTDGKNRLAHIKTLSMGTSF